MPPVQFERDHKRLLARYKQEADKDTSRAFLVVDGLAKRLAEKGVSPKNQDSLVIKLTEAAKKLKQAVRADTKERMIAHFDKLKKPPKDLDVQSENRTVRNVCRELLILERKVNQFAKNGGAPPPPPKLPELHYGADYTRLIAQYSGKPDPGVVGALDRLDETSDPAKVIGLSKAARVALGKQSASLAAELGKTKDPKEKLQVAGLLKELNEFRSALDEFETRIFLIHRLKG